MVIKNNDLQFFSRLIQVKVTAMFIVWVTSFLCQIRKFPNLCLDMTGTVASYWPFLSQIMPRATAMQSHLFAGDPTKVGLQNATQIPAVGKRGRVVHVAGDHQLNHEAPCMVW